MPETRRNPMAWLGNGLSEAQEKDEKTTGYLDTVDIPPAINTGPRPGKKGVVNGVDVNGVNISGGGHAEETNGVNGLALSGQGKVDSMHAEELSAAIATVPL